MRNLKTADSATGFSLSSGAFGREALTSLVVDSLFVGETENIGNPVTPEEKAYGRSLPKRRIPDFPIRRYEYYDYRVDVANTTFVDYQDNAPEHTTPTAPFGGNPSRCSQATDIAASRPPAEQP